MRHQSHTRLLWILLIATLIYWAICAVVLPVTTWDSQVYNLGRLAVADIGGFWSNRCWFSKRQVIFPWTFDAVHYPLVKAGLCESIPSFLTLIGLLVIVYKVAREWYSESFALWSCLSLISMRPPDLIPRRTDSLIQATPYGRSGGDHREDRLTGIYDFLAISRYAHIRPLEKC